MIKILKNPDVTAYTAIITDDNGIELGRGYGHSKPHAIKIAEMDASGEFVDGELLTDKIKVTI